MDGCLQDTQGKGCSASQRQKTGTDWACRQEGVRYFCRPLSLYHRVVLGAVSGWDVSESHHICKLTIYLLTSFGDPEVPWEEKNHTHIFTHALSIHSFRVVSITDIMTKPP